VRVLEGILLLCRKKCLPLQKEMTVAIFATIVI